MTAVEIGDLTFEEKVLILNHRIERTRKALDFLGSIEREERAKMPVADEKGYILFDLIVEKKRQLLRLEAMKRTSR